MTKDWKERTCEKCEYRVEKDCRKTPHWEPAADTKLSCNLPPMKNTWITIYEPACAEYKESEAI